MLFSEIRFPKDISYGAVGGPEFSTDIITTKNGYEQRNINWLSARIRYNVSHGVKTAKQLAQLISFFRDRKGKAYGFRFKDWMDFKCANQKIGNGNGQVKKFQLIKSYLKSTRIINKPVGKTVKIFVNEQELKTGYEVDYQTGLVIFDNPPKTEEIITATFEFDIPARFDTDILSASIDQSNIYSWNNIPIVEIKLTGNTK
ncbi:MAG: DUF2460 domain-containing protein [Rickettsiaceae bacterium H1]|nr:DUF2460 domain-containing protein [Rickettsiaceae bacterium H1]